MTKIGLRYKTQDDGKLHTSYSELNRCTTPATTRKAVLERNGITEDFKSEQMEFGSIRHKQWETESLETHRTPKVFEKIYSKSVDYIEQAFAIEIFKDVVLHFRPDAVSLEDLAVIDYKKIDSSAAKFKSSYQLLIYAYALAMHDIRVTKRVFLCEKWNKDNTKILGYERLELPVNLYDMSMARIWLKPRVKLLKTINDLYLKGGLV